MNKIAKKNLSLFIGLLLCAGTIVSCSSNTSDDDSSVTTTETTAAVTEKIPEYIPLTENFNGAEFAILHPSERYYDIAEEANGEIVNDAIYERDTMIAEMFNISFKHYQETDEFSSRQKYNDKIRGVVMSNDDVYDLIYGIEICTTETFTEGLYYNLLDFDEMKLEEIWWCPGQIETFAIDGKMFGAFGVSTMDLYKEASVIFANTKIMEDYDIEVPYNHVLDGKWTTELFFEMTAKAINDLNGDGEFTLGDDLFGYTARETNHRSWQTALGIRPLKLNNNGYYELNSADERTSTIIDVYKGFFDSTPGAMEFYSGKDNEVMSAFMADLSLFYCERLKTSEKMRDMESDYGVLPFPKYDEKQEDYYTQVATATTMILFPLSVSDPHMSAMVSEALSYYGYKQVVPKYYESALKTKYMRDESSAQVLDIIFANTVNDLTFAYATTLGGSISINMIFEYCAFLDNEYASLMETNSPIWQSNLDKLYEAYREIK